MDELVVEEILLRFPPDDPASLIRAVLVCKPWRRIISDQGFPRRYRARAAAAARCRGWRAVDARHGRVLLHCARPAAEARGLLAVWDPATDGMRTLPLLRRYRYGWSAAVLCAAAGDGCDHFDCHRGPFLVVAIGGDRREMFACVYSSEAAAWNELPSDAQHGGRCADFTSSVLVGNALYFRFETSYGILKYDLEMGEAALVQQPPIRWTGRHDVLTTTDGGGLGYATVFASKLYLWSKAAGTDGDEGWSQSRVIELDKLLTFPVDTFVRRFYLSGFADGIGVVFVRANHVFFTIDLKSGLVRKVYEAREFHEFVGLDDYIVVPYRSFCSLAEQDVPAMSPKFHGANSRGIWAHEHQHLVFSWDSSRGIDWRWFCFVA